MALVERVQSLLLKPAETWQQIDAEPLDIGKVYREYLVILAAIPALCGFVGLSLIGTSVFGVHIRISILNGIAHALLSFGLTLGGIYLMGLVITKLAPHFKGTGDSASGFKLAAYSSTPSLLGGVFALLPPLAILGIFTSLYSLYLLYLGLPVLMKNARESTVPYLVTLIVAGLVIGVVIGGVSNLVV